MNTEKPVEPEKTVKTKEELELEAAIEEWLAGPRLVPTEVELVDWEKLLKE